MKKHSRIEIKSTDGACCEVKVDGHVLHGVRSVKFEKKSLDVPILTLDLSALDISIDSPCIIKQDGMGDSLEIVLTGQNISI